MIGGEVARIGPLEAAPEPRNLRALKTEIRSRWVTVPLIDMLNEAVLRTGCLDHVTGTAGRGDLSREVLAERLLLVVYAYGTNTGIPALSISAHPGPSGLRVPSRLTPAPGAG